MRVWHPIPPCCLDRQRLLGEHREIHAIWVIITKQRKGYAKHPEVKRWQGHLAELAMRHNAVADEMISRGYLHKSKLILHEDDLNDIEWAELAAGAYVPIYPEPWEPVGVMRAKLASKLRGFAND